MKKAEGILPPQAIELEEAVLGAIMMESRALPVVMPILKMGSFYKDSNSRIYRAILELKAKNQPIDILTVTQQLKKTKELDVVGGAYHITDLTGRVASAGNVEFHARIIAQKFIQRELIRISTETINKAYQEDAEIFELIDNSKRQIGEVLEDATVDKVTDSETIFNDTITLVNEAKDKGGVLGLKCQIPDLTRAILGFQPGFVYVIAARPRIGKSALMKSIMLHCALHEIKCKIFSLEMTATQMMTGMLTEAAEVDNQKFSVGDITEQEWMKINGLRSRLLPYIEIDDKPAITIQYLESQVRRFVKNGGKMIAIDYLQLMTLSASDRKNKIREQEISYLSGNIKRIAKEYKVPVIELAQLSRDVEKRGGDKKPILSDLRESGSIEQDAEVIMFIQRPEADGVLEDKHGNSVRGIAKIILAKNRFGPCTDIKVAFTPQFTRYSTLMESIDEIEGISEPKQEKLF